MTALTSDSNDEVIEGTLELTGDALENHVLSGETFYSNNAKTKLTGTLVVNSLLSFSVAAYSGKRLLATWKNPTAADGKPYSGVYIRYSTSGYPGKTGGTQIYKGVGNNTGSGANSSVYLDMPSVGTTYYFSIYPYVTTSEGEMTGDVINASRATAGQSNITITSTRTYSVPAGYTKMDVFCVGGGGGGNRGSSTYDVGGGGGGGGYTKTVTGIAVSSGQSLSITVGAGGTGGKMSSPYHPVQGGISSVSRSGSILASVNGGNATESSGDYYGASGGSGGGDGGAEDNRDRWNGGRGGSNGSNGYFWNKTESAIGGSGQRTTTRAWGSSSGTLYSGGGGAAPGSIGGSYGAGGSGGGGRGGDGYTGSGYGRNGTANTGGGGGGSFGDSPGGPENGGSGGSGIVLLRFY